MNTYKLVIKLKSSTLVGSGVGFGAEIDTDIIFDELGLPIFLQNASKDVCVILLKKLSIYSRLLE
jgi:hypothetical protein